MIDHLSAISEADIQRNSDMKETLLEMKRSKIYVEV